MEYTKKSSAQTKIPEPSSPPLQRATPAPGVPPVQRLAREVQAFAMRPDRVQRQVAQPGLQAAALATQELQRSAQEKAQLTERIDGLQRQYSPEALATAQRQQAGPLTPPTRPQSVGDWVTVMRMQAEQMDGRRVSARESASFTQLQRQVSQTLIASYRADRQPPLQRQAEYGEHLATLQRQALSRGIPGFVIGQVPPSERPGLQRAVAEAVQRQQAAAEASGAARQLSDLQGQQRALEAQQSQALHERIQARRGAGNPLPAAVMRHLEQGLNHDLSLVRIHDDAEADKMAKSVNAIAFTTGTDIFFQSGHYDPNTQTGLELLAHEVTHTVQQSKGHVGKGIDPDAGLESEARETGRRLAQTMPAPHSLIPPVPHRDGPHAPGVYTQQAATERIQTGAARHTSLKPLRELSAGVQRAIAVQRFSLNPLDAAKEVLQGIPGYREVSAAVGHDLITGAAVESGPGVLEMLANWVPGPLKDILKALQETNVIGKAWDWFRSELGKLNLGGALGEIKDAIFKLPPDLGAAKNAVTSRIGGLKNLIVGSAKRIAEIALTAITAMLGPVGKQLMAKLKGSGDTIIKILKDPGSFAKNLMEAAKGGFSKFGQNAPTHLKKGLGTWLTGDSDGLKFPPQMDIQGVFMLAMTVSGVSYMNMMGGLQRKLGPNGAAALQRATMTLPALMPLKGGIEKAPEIASNQNAMGQEVVSDLKNEVLKSVVVAGIAKVASLLIPGGGFIQAIVGAFYAVQTLIAQGQQIAQVMIDGLSGLEAIAAGNISGAVSFIDRTLGGTIPVILSFMSRFLGLGRFGGKARGIIGKVKARLKAFEQRIVDRIGGMVQKILAKTKLDKTNLIAKHKAKQAREEQARTAQANAAASKRNAALSASTSKATQSGSKRNAESSRANAAEAQKANTANAAAAKTHKDSTDPNPRINIASKGEKAATATIDKKAQATKTAADQDAKKVKADADKAEKEAQALAKKQTKEAQSSADKDHKEAVALATRDAKGHPGSDTAKAKAEATQNASSVKAKAKGGESKTTSKAKADSKKAKDKAEQGAKKTKADADKEATKAKKKAKDDSAKAKKKAKDDAKKAQAKKKKDGDAKAKKPKNPKSPIKLKDKNKDSKKPKKGESAEDVKKRNQKDDNKEINISLPFNMSGAGHTLFLTGKNGNYILEMASKKDRLSNKIGRMIAKLKAMNYPSEYIDAVMKIGIHAKSLQNKIISRNSNVPEAKLRSKLGELGSKITELGISYGYKDIDSSFGDVRVYKTDKYVKLSKDKKDELEKKLADRSITKEEYDDLRRHNRISRQRREAVTDFWAEERLRLLQGQPGTRNWGPRQRRDILEGRTPYYKGKPLAGHHLYSVATYPRLSKASSQIYPVTANEHLYRHHNGNTRNQTSGKPLNPNYSEEM